MDLNGRRVLVTGADGFIGSHLVESLLAAGATVRALAQYNSFNHLGNLEQVAPCERLEVITGDIRDSGCCARLCAGVEVVFHLAALIAIPYSYRAPESYFATNVLGTMNICRAALDAGVQRVIVTSTSEVYGSARFVPITEEHPLQPQSPYSASKIGADAAAMSFYYSFGLPVTVARPFNTYGPRQSARAVIPTIITQIAAGVSPIRVGDLTPTRDFNFVKDTCGGFLALAESEQCIGETVNIASNYEISIGDALELIRRLMDRPVTFEVDSARLRPAKSEVRRLWGDNRKLLALTGFTPRYSLEAGLRETIDWMLRPEHLALYKTGIYNV